MQEPRERRSNLDRTQTTRAALVAAARSLFVEKSYADTGTPEIVSAAGVTRGALYHHFADKQDLFRAVVEAEAAAVAAEIETSTPPGTDAVPALLAGGRAFMRAMQQPGRTRLLLLDGPAVLGRAEMDAIDARHGGRTLREGLDAAMRSGAIRTLPLDALAALLGAMFDRAALLVTEGEDETRCTKAIEGLLEGLSL